MSLKCYGDSRRVLRVYSCLNPLFFRVDTRLTLWTKHPSPVSWALQGQDICSNDDPLKKGKLSGVVPALLREGPLVNQCLASEAGKRKVYRAANSVRFRVRILASPWWNILLRITEEKEATQRRAIVSQSSHKLARIRIEGVIMHTYNLCSQEAEAACWTTKCVQGCLHYKTLFQTKPPRKSRTRRKTGSPEIKQHKVPTITSTRRHPAHHTHSQAFPDYGKHSQHKSWQVCLLKVDIRDKGI